MPILRHWRRILAVGLLAALASHAAAYLAYAARAVVYPFGLDYGEGTVWNQAVLMFGPDMANDLSHPPFVVFNYTPFYHVLARVLAGAGMDPLYAGRAISLAALLAVCGLAAAIVYRGLGERGSRQARIAGAAVAALMPMTYQPVQQWAMQMRADMLGAALSAAGVYLAIGARGRGAALSVAMLVFVLALYTKQTELTAPAAALAVWTLVDLRTTLKAASAAVVAGGLALLALQVETQGGFWRHAFSYNINRFAWHHVAGQMLNRLPDSLGILSAVAALWLLWRRAGLRMESLRARLGGSIEARTIAVSGLWFLLATGLLVTAGKHGASSNYFIEWLCISAIPVGIAVGLLLDAGEEAAFGLPVRSVRLAALVLPVALIVHAIGRPAYRIDLVDDPGSIPPREQVAALIRDSAKPVVSEDLSLTLRAGKTALLEPSTMTELAGVGAWNPQPFLDLVEAHAFAFFVTETRDGRLTPDMFRTVQENYPVAEKLGPYIIRRPPP